MIPVNPFCEFQDLFPDVDVSFLFEFVIPCLDIAFFILPFAFLFCYVSGRDDRKPQSSVNNLLLFYLMQSNVDFRGDRVNAFVSDVTNDDLSDEIKPSSVDVITLVSGEII